MTKVSFLFLITVFLSHFTLAQWEKMGFPSRTAYTLLQTSKGLLAANEKVIYRSIDNGVSWDSLSSIGEIEISKMIQVGNTIIVVSSRGTTGFTPPIASIFRSDDFGKTLDSVYSSVFGANSIAFLNGRTYANLDGSLYISLDTARTWTKISPVIHQQGYIGPIIADESILYIIVDHSLYRSRDYGMTWDSLSIPFKGYFYNVLAKDSSIYVGTYSEGFYYSSDEGQTWVNASNGLPDSSGTRALFMNNNNLVASVSKNFQQTVYRYNFSEGVWHQFNEDLNLRQFGYVYSFANNSAFLFLASDSSIWRRPLGQWITGISENLFTLPADFFLFQNYPNPFNPGTTLTFSAKRTQYATLKIFDVLGREVTTLFAGIVFPGSHTFRWNPVNCSSGIYFARFNTGLFSMTREVVFLR